MGTPGSTDEFPLEHRRRSKNDNAPPISSGRRSSNSSEKSGGGERTAARRGSIQDDIRSIISGIGKTNTWNKLMALKFTSVYVVSGTLFAVLAFAGDTKVRVALCEAASCAN